MPVEIILPRVDMDMTSGKIARWYAGEGARVEKGALLFELETSKAAMEIEAPASGILRDVVPVTGDEIPVGQVIGWIYAPGEAYGAAVKPAAAVLPAAGALAAPARAAEPRLGVSANAGTGIAATPLARRLARQGGVALAKLTGTGVRGRIQAADVPVPTLASARAGAAASSGQIHRVWLRKGAGIPSVLLHGFGSELDSWRPLVAASPAAGPVLAVDLPAHGKSAVMASATLDAIAEAVSNALAAEGITTAHLVGHSLGGAVATLLAARADFTARSLFLLASGGLGPEINGAFIDGFLGAGDGDALASWLVMTVADPQILPRDFVSVSLRPRQRDGYIEGLRQLAAALFPRHTQAFDIRDRLRALTIPKRLVFGAADWIIPATHASGLGGSVGIHIFPGVGHLPHVEAQADVARLWLEVIRSAG